MGDEGEELQFFMHRLTYFLCHETTLTSIAFYTQTIAKAVNFSRPSRGSQNSRI